MLSFIQEYFYNIRTDFKFSNSMIKFYNDMKNQMNETADESAIISMDESMDVSNETSH